MAKKTVGICTLGCRVNQYETEALEERLISLGYGIGDFSSVCDAYIVNTCAVTAESERKSRQMIRRAKELNPSAPVVVVGCLSQVKPEETVRLTGADAVFGNRNKYSSVDAVVALLEGKEAKSEVRTLCESPIEKMSITRPYRTRAFIKTQDGCDNHCAYCLIKSARGNVVSRPPREICREICDIAKSGCVEFVLTGIETASYGKDLKNTDLASLTELVNSVNGVERIRFGSLEPSVLTRGFTDRIAECKKVMPGFHLSLQSGSDRILALMRRKYTSDIVLRNTEYIKEKFPDAEFTGDIIVGFPGETDEDFEQTRKLLKQICFLHVHIFPFSPRKGTEAALMKNTVSEQTKRERCKLLAADMLEMKAETLQKHLKDGKRSRILLENFKNGFWYGHTPEMIEAAVKTDEALYQSGTVIETVPVKTDGKILYFKPCQTQNI